jgi:uncharacterized protein
MAPFQRPPFVIRDQHLPQRVPIEAYGDYGFRFEGMTHPGSLLCLPSGIHGWAVREASEIDAEALAPVFDQAAAIDVLIIGTGRDIAPFPASLRAALREAGIGLEVMGTVPAIRTYNILLAEGRPVAAALIALI